MKKISVPIIVVLLSVLTFSAFAPSEKQNATIVAERQAERLEDLILSVQKLHQLVAVKDTRTKVQAQYFKVRIAFKKWEYLGEFLDPNLVKDKINGAPLRKIERNTFGMNILEPKGMQALDEMLFAEIAYNETEVLPVIAEMLDVLRDIKNIRYPIYDRVVLEASRTELIRLFTLGITGFDVPSSGHSIQDAEVVMSTMENDLKLYEQSFSKINKVFSQQLYSELLGAVDFLKTQKSFDSLDRLKLLTTYLNPIFQKLYFFHKESGIEMIHEVSNFLPPLNLNADNIFAPNLLDESKYIGLPNQLNTPQLVSLGKILFYDPILSANNQRSCASCHNPSKAFTDGNAKSLAMGYKGTVSRNAPTLINCVYSERFFHDLRAEALEDQIEHVVLNEKEFNTSIFAIMEKLQESSEYQMLFQQCFPNINGTSSISNQNVSFAISAFVSSLRAFNSPFDKYVRNESTALSESAKRGFNLFMGKAACGTCHYAPLFNGTVPPRFEESESEVLGVPENPYLAVLSLDADKGRADAKLKEQVGFYEYSFKTPTIRNIALTAPYMHNGAYKKLEDVMNFYNNGGGIGIGLDIPTQTLPADSLHLTKTEIKDVISFMQSLTDTSGLTSKPSALPQFKNHPEWNARKIGGVY
ncbi:MAG: cytochrome-c peroxidase [Chitinophagaceae bacterium]|nr:cytochrome-c peroxidase [Chitinophagaceae bacterium]